MTKDYEQNKTNSVDFVFKNVTNSKNNCIFAAINRMYNYGKAYC